MLLDLESGSMTMYKNDEKMGAMVGAGLCGELVWAAAIFEDGGCARIASAPTPPAPTASECASAVKFVALQLAELNKNYLLEYGEHGDESGSESSNEND